MEGRRRQHGCLRRRVGFSICEVQLFLELVFLLVASFGLPLLGAETSEWTPALTTGRNPLALLAVGDSFIVLNASPSEESLAALTRELQAAQADAKTDAEKELLDRVSQKLDTIGTVLAFRKAPDGRFWPYREWLLYKRSEAVYYVTEKEKKSVTVEIAGRPLSVAAIGNVLLVGTSEAVFEFDSSMNSLRKIYYGENSALPTIIRSMAVGDLNGDNQPELVVVSGQKTVHVYKFTGGKFQSWEGAEWHGGPGGVLGYEPSSVVVADLNEDGAGDIIVVNSGKGTEYEGALEKTYVDRNINIIISKRTEFDDPMEVTATIRPRSVAVADFTGDGHLDIVAAGKEELVLLKGRGDGTFEAPVQLVKNFPNAQFELPPAKLASGDINGDGISDLIVACPTTGKVDLYLGPLAGKLSEPTISLTLKRPVDLLVQDLDGDSDLDIAVLDQGANELCLFVQLEGNHFVRLSNPRLGHGTSFIAFGGEGGPESLELAFGSPVLAVKAAPNVNFRSNIIERPVLPPDVETTVEKLYYTFYEAVPPSVDVVVTRGGGIGGVPAQGTEELDYSFALLYDRKTSSQVVPSGKKGTTFESLVPQSGASGSLPVVGKLVDITQQELYDLLILFQEGGLQAVASPWVKKTDRPKITLPNLDAKIPGPFSVGDFNGDSIADLVFVDAKTSDLYVALGERSGRNVRFPDLFRYKGQGADPVAMAVADFDGDGQDDIAVVNAQSNDITVFWGRGDGTFERHSEMIHVGTMPMAVAAAPFSPKKKEEKEKKGTLLAVANFASDTISIVSFTSRKHTVDSVELGEHKGPISIAAGKSLDWLVGETADEYVDFAVACYASDEIVLLRGKGDGKFEVREIPKEMTVHNILATPLRTRDGHGPTSVVVGDFDNDALSDVAFSVGFPTGKLQLAKEDLYDDAVKEGLKKMWQDIFIYYSTKSTKKEGAGSSPIGVLPGSSGPVVDVTTTSEADLNVLAVLQGAENIEGMTKVSLIYMDKSSIEWKLLRQVPIGVQAFKLKMADLNGDNYTDCVVLVTPANQALIFWGPEYDSSSAQILATSPAPNALAAGTSSEGAWVLGGSVAWVSASPGEIPWKNLMLDVAGGYVRSAITVPSSNSRSPPVLVLVSYRQELKTDEVRVFSGQGMLNEATTPKSIWVMPHQVSGLAAGDLDGDAMLDIVVAYKGQDIGEVWLGRGERRKVPDVGTGCLALSVGDVTGDDIMDLAALYSTEVMGGVKIYKGTGDGTFIPSSENLMIPTPFSKGKICLTDVDYDRKLDIVVVICDLGEILVFHQGSFPRRKQTIAGLQIEEWGLSTGGGVR